MCVLDTGETWQYLVPIERWIPLVKVTRARTNFALLSHFGSVYLMGGSIPDIEQYTNHSWNQLNIELTTFSRMMPLA
jgi:hypothetical protein